VGIAAFSLLREQWKVDKIFKIEKKHHPAFNAMLSAFNKHVRQPQLPPFFVTRQENDKLMLNMVISRQNLIDTHNTSLNADPVLYGLYNSVVDGFVESLKIQEGTGLFSSLTKDSDHHPFVIFACEFINWAHTALVLYQMDDKNATKELRKRQEYLLECHDIDGLIPRESSEATRPTIARYLAHINKSITATIEKLTELQKYNAFKRSIEGISQSMLKVLETSLKSQYYMINCLPKNNFFPAEITGKLPHGYKPLDELEHARETILFKHLRLFLLKIKCPGNELVCSTPPEDISAAFPLAIEAFSIENTDENRQYKGASGFDEGMDLTPQNQTSLLTHQKQYLIELTKWLQAATLLTQFIQLHLFRGDEWSFCGKRGGILLNTLLTLITKIEASIKEQHRCFFEDYLSYAESLKMQKPSKSGPVRFKLIRECHKEMQTALTQIDEHRKVLVHEKENHAANKATFDSLECSLVEKIKFLSNQIPGVEQNLRDELTTISKEIQVASNTVTNTPFSYAAQVGIQSSTEKQYLLEVAIAKVLRLSNKFSFAYTLAGMEQHPQKSASKREKIACALFTIKLYELISSRIETCVNPHLQALRTQASQKKLSITELETIYRFCELLTVQDNILLLSQTLNFLCHDGMQKAIEQIKTQNNQYAPRTFINQMATCPAADLENLPILKVEDKGNILTFLKQHYEPIAKETYAQLSVPIERLIASLKQQELDQQRKEIESERKKLEQRSRELEQRSKELEQRTAIVRIEQSGMRTEQSELSAQQETLNNTRQALKKESVLLKRLGNELTKRENDMHKQAQLAAAAVDSLSVEKTIDKMIAVFASSTPEDREKFLSSWQDLCRIDKTTGLFMPKSDFAKMIAYQKIQQQIHRETKEIGHLEEAEKLIQGKASATEWTEPMRTAIAKKMPQGVAVSNLTPDLIRTHIGLRKSELDILKQQKNRQGLKQPSGYIWPDATFNTLCAYYIRLGNATEFKEILDTKSFLNAVSQFLLQENASDASVVDDILGRALESYSKAKQQERLAKKPATLSNYWQQIIYGLTMLGALSVKWLESKSKILSDLLVKDIDDKGNNAEVIDNLMILVELTPVLLTILTYRSQSIGELSFIRRELFDTFHQWLINMGNELYRSIETDRSTWTKIYTLQFLGSDLRLERVCAWSQGLLLMHSLIAKEENANGATPTELIAKNAILDKKITDFVDKLQKTLKSHQKQRSPSFLSWAMTNQDCDNMNKISVICRLLEEVKAYIASYRASFESSQSKLRINQALEGEKNAEQKAGQAEQKAGQAEQKAGQAEQKAVQAEQKAVQAEQKAVQAEQKAGQAEQKAGQAEQKAVQAEQKAVQAEQKAVQAEQVADQAVKAKKQVESKLAQRQKQSIKTSLSNQLEKMMFPISKEKLSNMLQEQLTIHVEDDFFDDLSRDELNAILKQCLGELCQTEQFRAYQPLAVSLGAPSVANNRHGFYSSGQASNDAAHAAQARPGV